MGKTCVICGRYSGIYPLCIHHLQMKASGEVVKCKECGTWYEVKNGCPNCDKYTDEEKAMKCIICGNPSPGHITCIACYCEGEEYMDSLDKNSSVRKMRDYYYNLKERIIIINGIEEAKEQCKKLLGIAIFESEINKDNSLLDRVFKDIETLLNKKREKANLQQNPQIAEERQERDKSKSKINTSQDGHNLESDMEVRIDDILYNSYILHCYGKSIDEITEKRKKCDWFIPISNGKGKIGRAHV